MVPRLSCALLSLVAFAAAAPAQAAFPGQNGKIAFTSERDFGGGGAQEVYAMNADGSGPTRLTTVGISPFTLRPAWSADGQRIAFEREAPDDINHEVIHVMNADGSGQTNRTLVPDDDFEPAWSPDGQKIAFRSAGEIHVMNADGSGRTPLTSNMVPDGEPAWSPDGQKIAFRSGGEIHVMNADGTGQVPVTSNAAFDAAPAWSPDGQRIVFQSGDDIYVMNADGTGQTNLTPGSVGDVDPAWSPDGQKIAFQSSRDGNDEIYVMNADGTGQLNLSNNAANDEAPDWQPLPAPACPDVPVGFATAKGCFTETTAGSGVFETDQKAWVGGFEIQPRPGGKLVLDTNNPGVSEGGAGVDVVFRGRALPLPVAALPVGFNGGSIMIGGAGTVANLFDVPVKGSVAVAWAENGTASSFEAEIEINELTKGIGEPDPSTLGSGKLKAKLANGTGFRLEEFEVKIDEISVTPARLIVPRKLKLKPALEDGAAPRRGDGREAVLDGSGGDHAAAHPR